jgi:hypothetical protein
MNDLESARIMYEIYQESGYDGRFRVVYFTELNERNREAEIARAMAGRHVHDGFFAEKRQAEAKSAIDRLLARLNEGESVSEDGLAEILEPFAP